MDQAAVKLSPPVFLSIVPPVFAGDHSSFTHIAGDVLRTILEIAHTSFEGRNELGGVVFRRSVSEGIFTPDFKGNGRGRIDTVVQIAVRITQDAYDHANIERMLALLAASQQSTAVEIGILDLQYHRVVHSWVGRIRPSITRGEDPCVLLFSALLQYNDPDGLAATQATIDRLRGLASVMA